MTNVFGIALSICISNRKWCQILSDLMWFSIRNWSFNHSDFGVIGMERAMLHLENHCGFADSEIITLTAFAFPFTRWYPADRHDKMNWVAQLYVWNNFSFIYQMFSNVHNKFRSGYLVSDVTNIELRLMLLFAHQKAILFMVIINKFSKPH